MMIMLIAILALVAVAGVYFLVVLPSRWHLPYETALPLLASDDRDDLEQADRLLSRALNAGPRGKALSRIRFAQAYTRAMLGTYDKERYGSAAATVDELIVAEGRTEHTGYLELWLYSQLDNHLRVTDLYDEHPELLRQYSASGRIAAASHLHLAAENWRRREVNGALHHFDKVQDIGELTDKVPPEARNLQLASGVQSFFDGRFEDAREAFTLAGERAAKRNEPALEPDLGILVCDWETGKPRELGERLDALADQAGQRSGDEEAATSLRTGIALLRVVVLLREWLDRPSSSGEPTPADLEEFRQRIEALRETAPDLGDGYLIDGLVRYYFAPNQPAREDALATLEKGTKQAKAVSVPEVRRLIEREREIGGEGHVVSRFLKLIAEFLADPDRSEEDRQRLRELKTKVIENSSADDIEDGPMPDERVQEEDRQRRVKEIRRQVEAIVYTRFRDVPDDDPGKKAHQARMSELDRAGEIYANGAEALHGAEDGLIAGITQLILPEDQLLPRGEESE